MNSNNSWNIDKNQETKNGREDLYNSEKEYKTASVIPQLKQNNNSFNNFQFDPNQLLDKLKKFFKNKFAKYSAYTIGAMFFAWIFLNLLIVPINRILGLPNVSDLESHSPISSIEVYDKDDQFVTVLQGKEDRQIITLDQVSTSLKQALFASEDREFYQHQGINFLGVLRALIVNIQSGKLQQGGSTITQQLVKNIFFSPKEWKTLSRKFKEALLTIEVEQKYTKDQILEFYLNQIYWGKGSYGVERAAKRYFNKSASDLNVAEAAYLVALLPSPSTLHDTPTIYKSQKNIIANMVKYGYISKLQARDALNYPLKFESAPGNLSKYPYYMSVVLDELRERFSDQELRHSGFKVYTSIDKEAQAKAEKILTEGIKKAPAGINQGALVTIDVPSNEVRVIVGGVGDFWKHQWNRATSIHTIGSAFKPFVYLTSFMKGLYSSSTLVMDSPFIFENTETGEIWTPKNFDNKFWGPITVRKALLNSRNIPAIRVAEKSTIESVQDVAQKVGLTGIPPYLSSALGSSALSPIQVANAYAVLARGGVYLKPTIIRRITDKKNKIIEQNNSVPERVLPSSSIYELIDILVDVVDHGTGTRAKIEGLQIAGKTGTADGARDVWFVGFTPDTVTALWGGNDKNKKASHYATGGGVMAGIWKNFMTDYYEINPTPVTYFPKPAKRVRLLIDPITGLLATKSSFQPEYREFVPGTQPKKYAPAPTPEQIEEYLEEMESQRQAYLEENWDDLENVYNENLEEELLRDESSEFDYPFRNLSRSNRSSNRSSRLSPPSVRPVLIQRRRQKIRKPVIPQNGEDNYYYQDEEEQIEDNSFLSKIKNKFSRREEVEEDDIPQRPPEPPQWRKMFNSPY
ncbi:MAG: PBP1A family penicillin-binding protein [Candidatus Caenarcaniphilales bacterium]|nr:PBP1A family penicillin-binding protein [Candidatus Caenarcaniphilales bacterium]